MGQNRVFLPQEALDHILEDGESGLEDEFLTLGGQRFRLETAVRFMAEVAEGGDADGLVGKVKSVSQIEAFDGDHSADSVIVGDNAYEVIEGFVAEPLPGGVVGPDDGSDPLVRLFMRD